MRNKIRVLHIDDNIFDRQLVKDALLKEQDIFEVVDADSRQKFESHLNTGDFDIVLSDFNILGFDGLQVLQLVKDKNPNMPVIIVTGTGSEEIAIQAMKMGASDYVIKTVNHIRGLAPTIHMVLENKKAQDERKIARAALRANEEKYRSIYENTGIAILLTSTAGHIFSANEFACKLFERSEKEICEVGQIGIFDITDPRLSIFLANRQKNGKVKGELTMVKRNISFFQAEVSSGIFIDSEGNERTSMVIRDLTEQKNAEKKIKTFELVIQQSPTSIIITDNEGKIEFVNTQFTNLMQYSLDEIKGKNPQIFNSTITPFVNLDSMLKTIQAGNIWKGEFNNQKKDGTTLWENVIIFPLLDEKCSLSNYILILEDITEKKKMLDDLIIAKQKAEESDRLKTAFLHNISHEIRTPMNAIMGFSGFLNDPGLIPEKRKHFVEIITQSCNQLLSIINDIVSIASIEAGQEKFNEKAVNINAILQLLYDQFSLNAFNKNVLLSFDKYFSDIDVTILTDESKLTGILTNLIGNAIKFTQKGSVVFGYTRKDTELEFYVEDTGIGIPIEFQDEIFKRFRQVEITTNRQFGGSGLGLSISKAYIEIIGGKICMKSEPGKGSRFYFTIPYRKAYIDTVYNNKPNSELHVRALSLST